MYLIDEKVRTYIDTLSGMKQKSLGSIDCFLYKETGYKESNELPDVSTFKPYDKTVVFDGNNKHYWFYAKLPPQERVAGKRLCMRMTAGIHNGYHTYNPECIVFLNGEIIQAFDAFHRELELEFEHENELYIHLYAGNADTMENFAATLCLVDEKLEKLYYDMKVPYDALMCLDDHDDNRRIILKELEVAIGHLDLRSPFSKEFDESVDRALDYLDKSFYHGVCGKSDTVVTCIGHTHIDVAWLWVLEQTAQKAQRTFATVLRLMDRYPEFKFMSSQPQLYEYVKIHAPALYEKIKERVQEGRWEVEGAMWLEADCNLTSGESLIRQIIHGKRFMKKEFGVDSKILWLPDVFGYSAALPQIMKKCGIDKFVTSKLGWNDFNRMPYDIFMWQGIDGSEVFTYFMTAQPSQKCGGTDNMGIYNAQIKPTQVLGTWRRFQQKELSSETLLTFGWGDGGGGPTADMLEQQKRLAYGLPGFPKTQIDTATNFLNRAYDNYCKSTELLKRMPRWVGELYFELHRGTLTSIAKIKKNNRKCEIMYQNLEKLSVTDMLLNGGDYDREYLNTSWKTILLHQFHDVLPGSSIGAVYDRTDSDYKELLKLGGERIEEKLERISSKIKTKGGIFVYNPNGFMCSDVIDVSGKKLFAEDIPPYGYKVINPEACKEDITVTERLMENRYYRIELDDECRIVSLYDKENSREVIKEHEVFNELQIFEDYPRCYDAWEISHYYKQKMWVINHVVSVEIVDEGVRKGLKITREYLNSRIVQTIYIYADIRRIDFDTYIDWKEEHLLLKAAFPVAVNATEAVYDIQFGNIKRPTHENTTWDRARFEVCSHKWADISDGGYGLSLMNDCKYGYSTEGSTLKLTLLKSATYPYPQADKEEHRFTYSIIPHSGGFKEARTVKHAGVFNNPLMARTIGEQDGTLPEIYSLVSCKNENILIDTVKKAEDSEDIIVRMYEYFDKRTKADITFGVDVKQVFLCDMLENNIKELCVCNNTIDLEVSNFEIVTLKIITEVVKN